ncbi:MAG: ribose 5-phosphate isomerase B [Actinomycetia bacterium]|nr:ribose 5-phosphate isomerase B [Actinomycetes bacterium]MCP4963032.1 ribose 5-phosphate isomerase B [Actinomycetes bacterium]
MHIAIGSDHAGFDLKQHIAEYLRSEGHKVADFGTDGPESCDYPPICAAVGKAVADDEADRGIVIGGSGQGEQIAANKVPGIRAALCHDLWMARMSRLHNDANVLSMGGRVITTFMAEEIVDLWLRTEFEGGRHQRRIDQLAQIDGSL